MEEMERGRRARRYARGGQAARLVEEQANERARRNDDLFLENRNDAGYGAASGGGEGGGGGGVGMGDGGGGGGRGESMLKSTNEPSAPQLELPSDENDAMLVDLIDELRRADTTDRILIALNDIEGFVREHPSLRSDSHRKKIMVEAKAKMQENRKRWTKECAMVYGKLCTSFIFLATLVKHNDSHSVHSEIHEGQEATV